MARPTTSMPSSRVVQERGKGMGNDKMVMRFFHWEIDSASLSRGILRNFWCRIFCQLFPSCVVRFCVRSFRRIKKYDKELAIPRVSERLWYCRWKKSCTSWDRWTILSYKSNVYILSADVLPSQEVLTRFSSNRIWCDKASGSQSANLFWGDPKLKLEISSLLWTILHTLPTSLLRTRKPLSYCLSQHLTCKKVPTSSISVSLEDANLGGISTPDNDWNNLVMDSKAWNSQTPCNQ